MKLAMSLPDRITYPLGPMHDFMGLEPSVAETGLMPELPMHIERQEITAGKPNELRGLTEVDITKDASGRLIAAKATLTAAGLKYTVESERTWVDRSSYKEQTVSSHPKDPRYRFRTSVIREDLSKWVLLQWELDEKKPAKTITINELPDEAPPGHTVFGATGQCLGTLGETKSLLKGVRLKENAGPELDVKNLRAATERFIYSETGSLLQIIETGGFIHTRHLITGVDRPEPGKVVMTTCDDRRVVISTEVRTYDHANRINRILLSPAGSDSEFRTDFEYAEPLMDLLKPEHICE